MAEKPNCYECKHRGEVPGSAHSRCNHPGIEKPDPIVEMMALLAGGHTPPIKTMGGPQVKGDPHGIRNGWFGWPFNFDPTWLLECDSFEKKSAFGAIDEKVEPE